MKPGIYILLVISLLVGLMGVIGCATSEGGIQGNSPETESFSTVVKMNGKELTVGAPTIATWLGETHREVVTVAVKNVGHGPITVAELELVHTEPDGCELPEWWKNFGYGSSPTIVVKDLSPGRVQTLCWLISRYGLNGSLKIEVKRLE